MVRKTTGHGEPVNDLVFSISYTIVFPGGYTRNTGEGIGNRKIVRHSVFVKKLLVKKRIGVGVFYGVYLDLFIAVWFCERPSWRWLLHWRCQGLVTLF